MQKVDLNYVTISLDDNRVLLIKFRDGADVDLVREDPVLYADSHFFLLLDLWLDSSNALKTKAS